MAVEKQPNIDEAVQRGWEIPDFTIKEIRDAIPAHCFRRDTFRSFTYVFHDVAIIALLAYLASWIDHIPSSTARVLLWPVYWIAQGVVGTGVWVIGHECGHQAFSPSKVLHTSRRHDNIESLTNLSCRLSTTASAWCFTPHCWYRTTPGEFLTPVTTSLLDTCQRIR